MQPNSVEGFSDLGKEAQQRISQAENDLQFSGLSNSLGEQDQAKD